MGALSHKFHRQVLDQARALVELAGGTCHLEKCQRGHPKLIIELRGHRRITAVQNSPKNGGDALKMKLADVRRIITEIGATKKPT